MFAVLLFVAGLAFHHWGTAVGWESRNLPGVEYRQAQTALSAYFIQQEGNFALAYPTPVLGKPWSVPMEFPLYQWTAVVTSNLTGLELTKAGRLVSIVCFYLTLPAVFLLLARWGVAPGRRWLVLALVVTCPLYIFYSRAFLIETMALMFALWFWVAFERAVAERSRLWLLIAVLAGTGAGLVKVTTFILYLLPAGVWALQRLWAGRADGRWRADVRWMLGAVAAPFAATLGWIWYSDRIKALNPLADFLSAQNLRDFNLGTVATHLSPEMWKLKLQIMTEELTWLPMFALAAVLLVAGARHRLGAVLACALIFVAALAMFPVLYALHTYYYLANTMALLFAVGLVVAGVAESPRLRWLGLAATLVFAAGQGWNYLHYYHEQQRGISPGGNGLSDALRAYTRPDEVVVITGQDWNSMTPYFAQRRALMFRENTADNDARIDAALHQLAGEKIGALVVARPRWREVFFLVRRLAELGLSTEPWLQWGDTWIFLPQDRWDEVVRGMSASPPYGVQWVPGTRPPGELGGRWHELAALPAEQQQKFSSLGTGPVRFLTTFEPQVRGNGADASFSVHPWTRLIFRLPRGAHTLTAPVGFDAGAYQVAAGEDATDGVEVTLLARLPGAESRVLGRRLLDPANQPADRGRLQLGFEFMLEQDGEVELVFDPGRKGRDTRDWLWLHGRIVIE